MADTPNDTAKHYHLKISKSDDVERPFERASGMPNVVALNATKRKDRSMEQITLVGLDLAKSIFQVHCIADNGKPLVRRALRRAQVLAFFNRLAPCIVGMEACGSAYHWTREIAALCHDVWLMPH